MRYIVYGAGARCVLAGLNTVNDGIIITTIA